MQVLRSPPRFGLQLQNNCITSDYGYVPFIVITISSCPPSGRITGFVTRETRRVQIMEQGCTRVYLRVCIAQYFVLCVVFCKYLLVFFLLVITLPVLLDLRLLITILVSSIFVLTVYEYKEMRKPLQ